MFAGAGVSGRILRNANRRSTQNSVLFAQPKPKKPKRKFRCYVPFMWPTCIAVFAGMFILMGGTAMCTVGYYAEHFSEEEAQNGTHTWSIPGVSASHKYLRVLAYAGPVLMGCGCFTIVVACVVICETRDKMIKIMEEREKERKAKEARTIKPNFYDLIIGQVRKDRSTPTPENESTRKEKLKKRLMRPSSAKSVKSEYGRISFALKRIPADIFTIDIEGNEPNSLFPIHPAKPHALPTREKHLATKYPSTSCLHDLLVMTDEELKEVFSDPPAWLSSKPQNNEHPPEQRKKLYEHETNSVFSVNTDEKMYELEKRTAVVSGNKGDRPRSPLLSPRTPLTNHPEESESAIRGSNESLDNYSDQELGKCRQGYDSHTDSDSDSQIEKDDFPLAQNSFNGGDKEQCSTDAFGASCDANDAYLTLGQKGLHGDISEKGVSRATSPEPSERGEQNSNIVVQVAVHRQPAACKDDPQAAPSSVGETDSREGGAKRIGRLDSKASISQVNAIFSPFEEDKVEDSYSLIEDIMENFGASSDTAMFQPSAFATRMKSMEPDSPDGKVSRVAGHPNPRPMTSFMKPSSSNPLFPEGRKLTSNLMYSRNMPRIKSATIGIVGLRPIRTKMKNSFSKKTKWRPRTSHVPYKVGQSSKGEDANIPPKKDEV